MNERCIPCQADTKAYNEAVKIIKEKYPGLVTFLKVDRSYQDGVFANYKIKSLPTVAYLGSDNLDKIEREFKLKSSADHYVRWME